MALNDRSKILNLQIEEEMKTSYINYSMSVIVSRALPDVRDGLKPSQRRILVAMNDLNLAPGRGFRKCAKIAGDTSGNYHPHGEGAPSFRYRKHNFDNGIRRQPNHDGNAGIERRYLTRSDQRHD